MLLQYWFIIKILILFFNITGNHKVNPTHFRYLHFDERNKLVFFLLQRADCDELLVFLFILLAEESSLCLKPFLLHSLLQQVPNERLDRHVDTAIVGFRWYGHTVMERLDLNNWKQCAPLAEWTWEFLRFPRICQRIPRNVALGILKNSWESLRITWNSH